jgi:hypothetical protein
MIVILFYCLLLHRALICKVVIDTCSFFLSLVLQLALLLFCEYSFVCMFLIGLFLKYRSCKDSVRPSVESIIFRLEVNEVCMTFQHPSYFSSENSFLSNSFSFSFYFIIVTFPIQSISGFLFRVVRVGSVSRYTGLSTCCTGPSRVRLAFIVFF